jgi:small basic protein (TIGR04137 family)
MSMDASLKAASALVRHRNVLKRDERLAKLKEEEKWREGHVLGLPKVAHRKAALAKVVKEEAAEGAEGAAATPAAAGAKAAAPAAGAKGAAPAAKGAAPAAKAAAPAAKGKK